jgi:hypothetical protein
VIFYVLAVACGATFYSTRVITHLRIFEPIRRRIIDHTPEIFGYLVQCTWCVSFWVAGGVVLVLDRFTTVPLPWAVVLTASAVTGIVESHIPED